MLNVNFAESSINEAIDVLRNKPIKSTMLERLKLIEQADTMVSNMPQPLQLGNALQYILGNCSLPIAAHDLLLGRILEELPNDNDEIWLTEFYTKLGERPQWLVDGGHISLAWDLLLSNGLGGLYQIASDELERRKLAGDKKEHIVFLEGMLLVYKAYQTYIERYASAASDAGKQQLYNICMHIKSEPPRTFYEALQLILMVGHIYSVYCAVNSTLTYGRLDELLLEYYQRDISAGVITRAEACALIDDFNCKNNLILGRGEHQMSGDEETDTGWFRNPTYDTPQYVILGGYSKQHANINNPLTRLFVEHIHKRFENPFYVYRTTKMDDGDLWLLICDKLRQNCSIMVYNDETQIPAMVQAGIAHEDAIDYTIHGCNWPDIPALYCEYTMICANLPHRIMDILINDKLELQKEYESIDEIYDALKTEFLYDFRQIVDKCKTRVNSHPNTVSTVLSCTDCFYKGTVKTANSIHNGAVKYPVIYNAIRYIGTATDIIVAIESLVFKKKKYSLKELLTAVKADFIDYDEMLYDCKHCAKYGTDNDLADAHAVRLMNTFLDVAEDATRNSDGTHDIYALNVTITDMEHISNGKRLMATPDGRRAYAPVSENLSPTCGTGSGELLPLLNTISKLPFDRIHSGALNLRLRHDWIDGEAGLKLLAMTLKTYFQRGGMQVQISVVSNEELLDAQIHPEIHRDLMVRITGYSAVFVDMSKKAQDEFMRRDNVV